MNRLFPLRDIQVYEVGNCHLVGKNDPRTLSGNVTNKAVYRLAAIVEIYAPA
jgi:hypothetical protein